MPHNFREELIFMLMMAGLMVLGMSIYNIYLADGLTDGFWHEVTVGYPLALIVALVCDGFLVGPLAKMLAFKHIFPRFKATDGLPIPLTISTLMVLGMVTCMSFFGILIKGHSLATYPRTWLFNLLLSLPMQILVVGPIARAVLAKIQRSVGPAKN